VEVEIEVEVGISKSLNGRKEDSKSLGAFFLAKFQLAF
jgi:hypothetical protein